MGIATAPQTIEMMVGEARLVSVSFENALDAGEVITGTPTAVEAELNANGEWVEVGAPTLTLASVAASTAALIIDNETIAIGRALQFKVSGQLMAGSPYTVLMDAATDSTPDQALKRLCIVKVVTS